MSPTPEATPQNLQFRLRAVAMLLMTSLLLACTSMPTQKPDYERIYTPQQLRDDLIFIDEQLRTIHPRLFARQSEQAYLAGYDATYDDLSWPRNRRHFYAAITPLLATFQDSHIQLQLPRTEFVRFASERGAFPLKVLISDDQVIVLADEQALPTIPVGAEIRRINGVPIEELIPLLGRMVPAETETGRQRLVQVHMPELLWAYFPESDRYDIDYYWRGNIIRETLEPGLLNEPLTPNSPPELTTHYGDIAIDAETSMLWLNDFNEQSDRFQDYLDELFVELRTSNKKNLVLDLRYNKGGITDNLKQLLSYLTPRSIKWADSASLKISDAFKRQHSQLIDTTKSQKYTAYFGWLPMEYLTFWQWELLFSSEGDLLETSIDTIIDSQENYFQGNIIVLSNGYCFSACAALVSNLKSHNLATIIGEAPGSFIGSQFGYPVDVKLPNTGLILTVPAMEVVLHRDVGNEEDLSPDHRVTRRKMDVRMGYDVVFLAALELIKLREQAKKLSNPAELH